MSNKVKYIVTTVLFSAFVAVFSVMCVVRALNPVTFSTIEKRPMAQFPTDVTWQELLNNEQTIHPVTGEIILPPIEQFEKFTADQFPLREFFRYIKAHFTLDILNLKENNGYAVEDGSIVEVKSEYTEEELAMLNRQIAKLASVYNKFLANNGGNKYVAIVPDKNYYFGSEYGYLSPDYDALIGSVTVGLPDFEYVDLFGSLELSDYYKTDWHWNQKELDGVMSTLGQAMGFGDRLSGEYTEHALEGFVGGYYALSALYPTKETLTYLTNDILDACTVYEYATGQTTGFYHPDIFENTESYATKVDYDFFMNGRCGVQRIDNPNATTDKELVVFRDSFGASILPLLAEGYKTIYSIDLRDTMSNWLDNYVDFEGKDVLFLFSTTVLTGDEAFK